MLLLIMFIVIVFFALFTFKKVKHDEYIICSAIHYQETKTAKILPINIDKGTVVCGHRHAHCIHTLVALTGLRSVENAPDGVGKYEQGFLTNKNRFVDRKEALKIARIANQLNDRIKYGNELYSEDLY